jgi:hypothetical protein
MCRSGKAQVIGSHVAWRVIGVWVIVVVSSNATIPKATSISGLSARLVTVFVIGWPPSMTTASPFQG